MTAAAPGARDVPGTEEPPASRGRMLRASLLALSVGLVLAGAVLVPMPLVETAPGAATDVGALLSVGDATPVSGGYGLLTVQVDQPSIAETLRAALDDDRTLRHKDAVVPSRVAHRTYLELQRQEFRRSFRVAAAVGLAAAGRDVTITTAPQVAGVQTGGPAEGHLQVGDVIRRLDGTPVASTEDLVRLVRRASVGDRLVLDVDRAGRPVEVVVEAGRVPGLEHPGMGIALQTLEEDIELPADVDLVDQREIGGPSAGLMVALAVYDLVADEDLAAGRHVVGTGTIDGTGVVGRVGSVREKALAAVASGASVMLVPASQAAEARRAADGRIEVVGVNTFDDALRALRR